MANKFGKCTGGFSFLELLVSIGIFAVITTAVVVNFRSGAHANELRLAAQQLASDLRSLYTKAQAGTTAEFEIANGTIIKGATPLPLSITLDPVLSLIVIFKPPEPHILINNAEQESGAKIELTHTKTNQKKTVIIKRVSGRIDVE